MGHMPEKLIRAIGRGVGVFIYYIIPIRRSVSRKNIRLAFPKHDTGEIERTQKKMYRHYGKVMMEFFSLPFLSSDKLGKKWGLSPDAENICQSHKNGIILSAHFGNWELIPHILASKGLSMIAIVRPQKNAGFDRMITRIRNSSGCKMISSKASSRDILKEMPGNFLIVLGDQRGGRHGVDIDFFGKKARSPKGFCVFHLKTGIPIFFTTVTLGDDGRYFMNMEEIKIDAGNANIEEQIRIIDQKYHHLLETEIKRYPEQYFWFHRKWL